MLKICGVIYKDGKILKSGVFESKKPALNAALLECLEFFAHEFDIEIPMWHTYHTKEFAHHKKTEFKPDDFIDRVGFDKFEIRILA